jgi:hypothetical protein
MDWPEGERHQRNSFSHPMQCGFAVTFHEYIGGIRPDPAACRDHDPVAV